MSKEYKTDIDIDKQEFGNSLSKKDMLDLLTYYLVMEPVHQAIYSVN